MNKTDLITSVASRLDVSKAQVKVFLNEVIATITETLENGEKISINELGNFKVVQRKAKVARNPKTGAKVDVPAKKTVAFKVSKNLKSNLK